MTKGTLSTGTFRAFKFENLENRTLLSDAQFFNADYNDIAYDADANLHVAWYDTAQQTLMYASSPNTGGWSNPLRVRPSTDTDVIGTHVAVATDPFKGVGIVYRNETAGRLQYVHKPFGGSWSNPTDVRTVACRYPSLAYTANDGTAIVSYQIGGTALDLAVSKKTSTGWVPIPGSTPATAGNQGAWSSLALIPGTVDRFAVAYEDASQGKVFYRQQASDGSWQAPIDVNLDLTAGSEYISLAFTDSATNPVPAIAYEDGADGKLIISERPTVGGAFVRRLKTGRTAAWQDLMYSAHNENPSLSTGQFRLVYQDLGRDEVWYLYGGGTTWASDLVLDHTSGDRVSAAVFQRQISYTHMPEGGSTLFVDHRKDALVARPVIDDAVAASPTEMRVEWSYPTTATHTGFKVDRTADGGQTWLNVGSAGAATRTFTDSTVTPGGTYGYAVRAVKAQGFSVYSAAETEVAPNLAAPGNFAVQAQSQTEIDLSWTDVAGEHGYVVERLDAGTTWTPIATVAAATGGTVTHRAGQLQSATAYTFRVRAFAGPSGAPTAYSPYAAQATATTQPIPAPPAPASLSALSISATRIDLSWADVAGEAGYEIHRSPNGTTGWATIGQTGADITTFADAAPSSGARYYYRVVANSVTGDSPYSPVADAYTRPDAPANAQATALSPTAVDLTWTDVSGETGYVLARSLTGADGWTNVATLGANVTSFSDIGLAPYTTYHYQLRATNAGGASADASPAPATTLQDPSLTFTLSGGTLSIHVTSGTPFYLRHSTADLRIYKNSTGSGTPLYIIDDPFADLAVTCGADDFGKLEWVAGAAALSELVSNGGELELTGAGPAALGTLTGSGSLDSSVELVIDGDIELAGPFVAKEDITVGGTVDAASLTFYGQTSVGGFAASYGGGLQNYGRMTLSGNLNFALDVGNSGVLTILGDLACQGLSNNNNGTLTITGNVDPRGSFGNNDGSTAIIGGHVRPLEYMHNGTGTLTIGGDASAGEYIVNGSGTMTIGGDATAGGSLGNVGTMMVAGDARAGVDVHNGPNARLTVFGDVTAVGLLWNAATGTILHEGFVSGGTVTAEGVVTNEGTISPFAFLAVDSDNSGVIDAADNPIEDDPAKPGKLIAVNVNDTDNDGIVDFADGYDWDGIPGSGDEAVGGERFTPIRLTLPATANPATALIKLNYDASDPSGVSQLQRDPFTKFPATSGHLRIWNKAGDQGRNKRSLVNGGDWVKPGEEFNAARLTFDASGTATLWIEAIRPSAAAGDQRIEVQVDLDGTLGPAGFVAVDGARITAFDVKLTKVLSDQIPNSNAHFLPGGTGYEGPEYTGTFQGLPSGGHYPQPSYLLVGTRGTDDRLYLKADFEVVPNLPAIRDKLGFAIYDKNFNGATLPQHGGPSGAAPFVANVINGNRAFLSGFPISAVPVPRPQSAQDLPNVFVGWGLDADGDGRITQVPFGQGPAAGLVDEIHGWSPYEIKPVTNQMIGAAHDDAFVGGWVQAGPYTRKFLTAFRTNAGIVGAQNFPDGATVAAGEFKLDHNMGAVFNAEGVATVDRALFVPQALSPVADPSALVDDASSSATMKALITATLGTNNQAIRDWFHDPANAGNNVHTFNFQSAKKEVTFASDPQDDFYTAMGDMFTEDVRVTVTVTRKTHPVTGTTWLESTTATLSGKATDLYDFRADTFPAVIGAAIQAGYDGTAPRTGGRIFKYELDFTGSGAVPVLVYHENSPPI